jgi:hypothetical protein
MGLQQNRCCAASRENRRHGNGECHPTAQLGAQSLTSATTPMAPDDRHCQPRVRDRLRQAPPSLFIPSRLSLVSHRRKGTVTQRPTATAPTAPTEPTISKYSKLTSDLPLRYTHTSPQRDLHLVEPPCHDSLTPFQPLVLTYIAESHWTFLLACPLRCLTADRTLQDGIFRPLVR